MDCDIIFCRGGDAEASVMDMKYRRFKKTGDEISLMGFGTMRLPVIDGDNNKIDEDEAIKMIRYAIDNGVNYVDTAYMYHGGNSETVTGKALKDGYREKVFLADKLPLLFADEAADMERIFNEQLTRLDVDYLDMYLMHNVFDAVWKKAKKFDAFSFLRKKQEEGKIKNIGFSYHGETPEFFKEIIDYFPWDFCQIQLNYMDTHIQAGLEGLKYAEFKGVPTVIMEPLKGGKLTDFLPESIRDFWKDADIERTPAEWALRWVANLPQVLTILNGVSNMDQVKENISILSEAEAGSLTQKEMGIIEEVGNKYNELIPYSCTVCRYCIPCPQKIDIPDIIERRNEWTIYDGNKKIKDNYAAFVPDDAKASACVQCGQCEGKCPQHLPIIQIMDEAKEIFE